MQVLNKGYAKLVEHWGSDERIIEAARMSTNKGFKGWGPISCEICVEEAKPSIERSTFYSYEGNCPKCKGAGNYAGDEKLLKYLWTNKHHTPFEMAGATFEIYAPIFVIREWHRHRTFSYNEMSGRYTELPNDYYMPDFDRLRGSKQSTSNKQNSDVGLDDATVGAVQTAMHATIQQARAQYEWMLSKGVAREVARMVLPVSQYSRFRTSGNLRNWLHFLNLRLAENAQYEIRQYAEAVGKQLNELFPRTYALFSEGK